MTIGSESSELVCEAPGWRDTSHAQERNHLCPPQSGVDPRPTIPAPTGAPAGRTGQLTVDRACIVLAVSRTAEIMLARADALVRDSTRLRALRRADDEALQQLVARAVDGASGSLILSRRWGGRDYLVAVSPARSLGTATATVAASILIADPDYLAEPTPDWLQHLFGLTFAEARLALRLFAGDTVAEAAAHLGTSLGTARVHLGHVFRKTRTARQAELIRLLMSYPWDVLTAIGMEGASIPRP